MTLVATVSTVIPGYYVSIDVTGLTGISPAYDTLLVQRNNPDGSISVIRNGNNVATLGANELIVFDYEAPLNVAVSYLVTAIRHDGGGGTTTGTVTTAVVTIPFNTHTVMIKSLANPTLSMELALSKMDDPQYPVRQQVNPIIGGKYPTVITDVQGARTGTFTFRTDTLADRRAFLQLFQLGATLLFQANSDQASGDGYEDAYFKCGQIGEGRPEGSSRGPTRLWTVPYTEVASPSGSLTAIPGNSWLAVTGFGTWQSVLDNRSTWLDVLNRAYGS